MTSERLLQAACTPELDEARDIQPLTARFEPRFSGSSYLDLIEECLCAIRDGESDETL